MEKNITNDIIDLLTKEPNHIRGIAHRLGVNHVTIRNKLRDLADKNIVDSRSKGKNKVYYLKSSVEAKNAIYQAEIGKLDSILGKYPLLRPVVKSLQDNPEIKLAVLFGSYAKNIANKDSDIDIYIKTNSNKLKHEVERLNSHIVVKTGNLDGSNFLAKEIYENHVIIKGLELFYENRKVFS